MDTNENNLGLSLGRFCREVAKMENPRFLLKINEVLNPLAISAPIDRITVILGASPYIAMHSGLASITLSHIQEIKRSVKRGRKSYKIICGDYTASNTPEPVAYYLYYIE